MDYRKGIWFGLGAYVLWGLTPLYWNLVPAPPAVLVASRIIWALPVLVIVVTVRKEWRSVARSYRGWRPVVATVTAALLLLVNWSVFLWAVTSGHIVDVSLGYFINPLVSVALGVVILKERLRPLQWVAVGIAVLAVSRLAFAVGGPPWIALVVAFSFGLYGLLKKHAVTPPPLVSLLGETSTMFLPAVGAMIFLINPGAEGLGSSAGASIFVVSAGLVSVIPLLLFGASVKRIPLSMLGFLQYIAPSLQLLIGVFVFNETMTSVELQGFVGVWVALAIFTYDVIRDARRERTAIS